MLLAPLKPTKKPNRKTLLSDLHWAAFKGLVARQSRWVHFQPAG
jgi:hypothetical protein